MEQQAIEKKKHDKTRPKINKKGRLIIRNLSFKATEEAVQNWFLRYGEVTDVQLLKKQDGTLVGCGFVQFKTVPNAARAIKECNAKPFLGRPIAVDWAIPKQKYAAQNDTPQAEAKEAASQPDESSPDADKEEKEETEEEEDEEDESGSDEDADDDDALSESDGEGNNAKADGKPKIWNGEQTETARKSDVDEGKTVFIRNLDFSTSQEALKSYMEQFGSVHYALLCMDKVMERPKGTGFVKFRDAEAAQKCINESRNSTLQLDGRTLDAVLAVTRENLEKQKQEQQKIHKDKRNLFLAREGYIRPGTRAAQGVSATDMAKRQQNELWKKQMLRNLHMFISRERLCVHNLPLKMTDKQLAKLFLKHSSKDAKIVEAKVMRDLKKLAEGNVHPSKGHGFVTFTKHEDALLALRNINNNPTIFTNDKRPIVEFSVENRAAIKAKEQRVAKSRENVSKGKKKSQDKPQQVAVADPLDGMPVPEFSGAKADPKIKGLPSHSGPKIRHRKRSANPSEENGQPAKKPKITRKMFKNPASRKGSTTAKKTASQDGPGKKAKVPSKKPGNVEKVAKESSRTKTFDKPQQKKKWFDS